MSTTVSSNGKSVRLIGLVAIIAGVVLIVGGALTWGMVRSQLAAENITLGDDVAMFAGNTVDGPIDAYLQADIINQHALAGSDGKTYAELDREDPARASVMNGSFLRASLFTSVIAFGVAAFAAGMGLLFVLVGYALRQLVPVGTVVTTPEKVAAI
ncbi:aromatic ring-opening dioxygenase LigA [Actinotalea sp. K2]|uniref:aromatic ring-opening dioxygenase LigA n=1 Tax=Actinotalea sp. K2 TaxID=2939438 RepID=UPI002016B19A|nr:aromatic ring-opening dioxygenase LigA [Actinotalea sp. K2]MCL3859918.1 aromatic ring-opening dioxygenase LigA [Actinotalea sp. K2]